MDLTFNLSDLLQLGVIIVGVVVFLLRRHQVSATSDAAHETRLDAQGRELGEVKKRIDALESDAHLVVRLEERVAALTRIVEGMPQMVRQTTQEGMSAALRAVLDNARRVTT